MPLSRISPSIASSLAWGCAAGALLLTVLPAHAASQGTVAVTGDGTSAQIHSSTVEGEKTKSKNTPAAKSDGKSGKTETASREDFSDPSPAGSHAITALVNDEPITAFEIEQRSVLLTGGAVGGQAKANFEALIKNPKTTERLKEILREVVAANQGKSRDEIIAIFEQRKKEFGMGLQRQALDSARKAALPAAKKQALDELIDERLKLQEAKRQNVTIEDSEVDRIVGGIAQRNNMSLEQFTKQIGGSLDPMKARIRAALAWQEVVKRRFGPYISVTSKDVDKLMASPALAAEDDVELQLQRVSIAMPAKLEEHGIAARIQEADQIRSKFSDCKSTSAAATGVRGAKFEDLGKRRPSQFQEPTRTLLLNASDGEMLPPTVGDGAVELWVVCGRTVVKAETEKRNQAEGELKQKEFEVMARRYLKDLRDDAHIEYR